jgi:hypothetical protein
MALVAAVALLAGCGGGDGAKSPAPTAASPTALDRSIRQFDFGNATWRAWSMPVRLANKAATVPDDGIVWRFAMASEPVYADVNGDGAEDAAAALSDDGGGGNARNTSWYVWLWENGTAHQLDTPVAQHTRCGPFTDAVRGVEGGFEVLDKAWDASTTCAEGGAAPLTYVVGLRDGFLVRIRPRPAPLEVCNPRDLATPLRVRPGAVAYLARDLNAPRLPDRRYEHANVDTRDDGGGGWRLALVTSGAERFCAWLRTDDVIG